MLATHILTHTFKHTLWLVKIHMSPTKSYGSHINFVGLKWILTDQRECVNQVCFLLMVFVFG